MRLGVGLGEIVGGGLLNGVCDGDGVPAVGVIVGVRVAVLVGVLVGVIVFVRVGVLLGVFFLVTVGLGLLNAGSGDVS